MNINDLTIGQAKELAELFAKETSLFLKGSRTSHKAIPVVVCTDRRGVVFGYTSNADARPITLDNARMCLYWSSDVGGVFGLAEVGPTKDCKISATAKSIVLEGVTCVMSVDDVAAKAWVEAPVQGRK